MDKIQTAYKTSENIYDDVLTKNKWWSRLYINLFWSVDDNELSKKVLHFIPDDFDGKMLDVPVGTGVFTVDKYSMLTKAEITCIEYSEAMLKQAKKNFARHELSNIKCMNGDVGNLKFEDESFDIVLSMNGFHAFPYKNEAFQETFRVLKKGGMFIGCFYIKGEYKPSDFVVNSVLVPKGWFTPPFQTRQELTTILSNLYTEVELITKKAMAYFKCIK